MQVQRTTTNTTRNTTAAEHQSHTNTKLTQMPIPYPSSSQSSSISKPTPSTSPISSSSLFNKSYDQHYKQTNKTNPLPFIKKGIEAYIHERNISKQQYRGSNKYNQSKLQQRESISRLQKQHQQQQQHQAQYKQFNRRQVVVDSDMNILNNNSKKINIGNSNLSSNSISSDNHKGDKKAKAKAAQVTTESNYKYKSNLNPIINDHQSQQKRRRDMPSKVVSYQGNKPVMYQQVFQPYRRKIDNVIQQHKKRNVFSSGVGQSGNIGDAVNDYNNNSAAVLQQSPFCTALKELGIFYDFQSATASRNLMLPIKYNPLSAISSGSVGTPSTATHNNVSNRSSLMMKKQKSQPHQKNNVKNYVVIVDEKNNPPSSSQQLPQQQQPVIMMKRDRSVKKYSNYHHQQQPSQKHQFLNVQKINLLQVGSNNISNGVNTGCISGVNTGCISGVSATDSPSASYIRDNKVYSYGSSNINSITYNSTAMQNAVAYHNLIQQQNPHRSKIDKNIMKLQALRRQRDNFVMKKKMKQQHKQLQSLTTANVCQMKTLEFDQNGSGGLVSEKQHINSVGLDRNKEVGAKLSDKQNFNGDKIFLSYNSSYSHSQIREEVQQHQQQSLNRPLFPYKNGGQEQEDNSQHQQHLLLLTQGQQQQQCDMIPNPPSPSKRRKAFQPPFQTYFYRDLIWKVNYSNGIYVQTPVQYEHRLKAYIGKGNNSSMIMGLVKRRLWFAITDKIEQANFVWTQLKQFGYFQKQSKYIEEEKEKVEKLKEEEKSKEKANGQKQIQQQSQQPPQLQAQQSTQQAPTPSTKPSSLILTPCQQAKYKAYLQKYISFQQKTTEQFLTRINSKHFKYQKIIKQKSIKQQRMQNHLLHNYVIGNKKALFSTMTSYYTQKGQDVFDYLPLTFHITKGLQDQTYYKFLKYYYKRGKQQKKKNLQNQQQQQNQSTAKGNKKHPQQQTQNNVWILKPGENSNRGNGIQVCFTIDEIKSILKNKQRHPNGTTRTHIIQQYIEKPLLYQKRKFDIRHFIMITCINGKIKGYWFKDGYIRTTSNLYSLKGNSGNVHLTNDAVQKRLQDYGKYEKGNKISYDDLENYVNSTRAWPVAQSKKETGVASNTNDESNNTETRTEVKAATKRKKATSSTAMTATSKQQKQKPKHKQKQKQKQECLQTLQSKKIQKQSTKIPTIASKSTSIKVPPKTNIQSQLPSISLPQRFSFSQTIIPQMKKISTDIIKACSGSIDPQKHSNNFQIYGLDFMIDSQYKTWLIEVNSNPCLELSCPLIGSILPRMIENALQLTLDCMYPPPVRYTPKGVHYYKNLQKQNGFELVYDEERDGLFIANEKKSTSGIDNNRMLYQEDDTFEDSGDEWQED